MTDFNTMTDGPDFAVTEAAPTADEQEAANLIDRIVEVAYNQGWFARQHVFKARVIDGTDVNTTEAYGMGLMNLKHRIANDPSIFGAKDEEEISDTEDRGSDAPTAHTD